MIDIELTEVSGWKTAIRGMRNPMNSWEKSDSGKCKDAFGCCYKIKSCENDWSKSSYETDEFYCVGFDDHELMMKLIQAGTDHRKFLRMITVSADITAPFYWWKEFDTYKVGTVANSCSTMHKIHTKPFSKSDFSCEKMDECGLNLLEIVINYLNSVQKMYNDTHEKSYWYSMIQTLPNSYNQKRTVMMNYEVLRNMYHSRKNHKLDEWHGFCRWVEGLPYSELITGGTK